MTSVRFLTKLLENALDGPATARPGSASKMPYPIALHSPAPLEILETLSRDTPGGVPSTTRTPQAVLISSSSHTLSGNRARLQETSTYVKTITQFGARRLASGSLTLTGSRQHPIYTPLAVPTSAAIPRTSAPASAAALFPSK